MFNPVLMPAYSHFINLFHLIADFVGFMTHRSVLKYLLNSLTFSNNWCQKKTEQDLVQTDQGESGMDVQTERTQFILGPKANN